MLGAKRKTLAGFSSTTAQPHQGFIFQADLVQRAPPGLRQKTVKLVAGKCALLARVDAFGQDPAGGVGSRFKVNLARAWAWRAVLLQQASEGGSMDHGWAPVMGCGEVLSAQLLAWGGTDGTILPVQGVGRGMGRCGILAASAGQVLVM